MLEDRVGMGFSTLGNKFQPRHRDDDPNLALDVGGMMAMDKEYRMKPIEGTGMSLGGIILRKTSTPSAALFWVR